MGSNLFGTHFFISDEDVMRPDVIRAEKRMSQWEVASQISTMPKMTPTRLSLIERGFIEPNEGEKHAIASALGVSIEAVDWPKRK